MSEQKNPQKPHKQLTQWRVSQTKFARLNSLLMIFDEFGIICNGAANKVVKQDYKNGKDFDNIMLQRGPRKIYEFVC